MNIVQLDYLSGSCASDRVKIPTLVRPAWNSWWNQSWGPSRWSQIQQSLTRSLKLQTLLLVPVAKGWPNFYHRDQVQRRMRLRQGSMPAAHTYRSQRSDKETINNIHQFKTSMPQKETSKEMMATITMPTLGNISGWHFAVKTRTSNWVFHWLHWPTLDLPGYSSTQRIRSWPPSWEYKVWWRHNNWKRIESCCFLCQGLAGVTRKSISIWSFVASQVSGPTLSYQIPS